MIQFLTENWLALTIAASPFVLLEIVRAHRRQPFFGCPRLHDVQDQEARDEDAERLRAFTPLRTVAQDRGENITHNGWIS